MKVVPTVDIIVNKKLTDDDRRVICKALEQYNRGASPKEFYNTVIMGLIKAHKIKVGRWLREDHGLCYREEHRIDIPRPVSFSKFLTCLHEIAHLVVDKTYYPSWKSEYLCMKFEFDFCIAYGIPFTKKAMTRNKNYMRQVIIEHINSGKPFNDIDMAVLKMASIKSDVWIKKLNEGKTPKLIKKAAYDQRVKWVTQ